MKIFITQHIIRTLPLAPLVAALYCHIQESLCSTIFFVLSALVLVA